MKKLLLMCMGVVASINLALATDCPGAEIIPAAPTLPYTVGSIVCGTGNDITSGNAANGGNGAYLGGLESVYTWTPTYNYTGATIAYSGQSWSAIFLYSGCPTTGGTLVASTAGSATSKTLNIPGTVTAGTTYYIVFDTWPSPPSACPGTFTLNGTIVVPPTPPAPVQAAGTPVCGGTTDLTVAGTPPANETWYWQTTATGTSTATPVSGPYAVSANGTYYVRSYSTSLLTWSAASSVTVSNFPSATAVAPTPVPAQNPACVNTGTTLTVPAAPAGVVYYWQGTVASGSSTSLPATAPYSLNTTGTYYVAAYETATQCWSPGAGVLVNVQTNIPGPTILSDTLLTACTGSSPINIAATVGTNSSSMSMQVAASLNVGPGATVTTPGNLVLPVGAVATSATLTFNNVTTTGGTWPSDVNVSMNGALTMGTVVLANVNTGVTNAGPYNINLPASGTGGAFNLVVNQTYAFGGPLTTGIVTLTVNYTMPAGITWFDAPTGGNQLGTGSPFNVVGTSVMPNSNTAATYNFYAGKTDGACVSNTRDLFQVNLTPVLAALTPVNVSCNNQSNGSFTLGTVTCGTIPFTYSIDGGATFGPIPTTLGPGIYNIIIKDATTAVSSPIPMVITEPTAPTSLAADAAYFSAELSWVAQGNESDWVIEWGPAGFTPGTGTIIDPATNPYTLTDLEANTAYEFYVAAGCVPGSAVAGPFAFSTDPGFMAWDNSCGAEFMDISGTGTNTNLTDDTEFGLTLPWPWNVGGTVVNTITIGNNGGVLFNTLAGNVGYDPTGAGLYPYNQDLNTAEPTGGVFYQSIGATPGSRQFVIMWKDISHYTFPAVTEGATFELIVDEATGEVFYIYNDVMMGNPSWNNGADAVISANSGTSSVTVSSNNATYLTNNSCVRIYNALCPKATNLVIDPNEEDADLDWTPGQYGETEWTVIYGPAGFDLEGGEAIDTLTALSSDINLFPLAQNTQYDVYIFSECALDGLTSDGLFATFTTAPYCTTPTALTAATDVDSLEAGWNWVINPDYTGYDIEEFNIQYGMTGFELGTGMMHTADGTNNADTVFSAAFLGGGVYQYYIQAVCSDDTVSAWAGPITFVMPLANDLACSSDTIPVDGTARIFNNAGATVTAGEAAIAPPADGAQTTTGWINQTLNGTVWYQFIAPASGNVRVNMTGINYNGQAAVYAVDNCSNLGTFALQAANDNDILSTSLAPNFTVCGLTSGEAYYLLFDAFNATTGNYSIALSAINLEAGAASTDPLTLDVCSGADADLFSTITGEQTGGVWSSSIPAVNASITGSTLGTEGLAYTTYNIQYRVTDGCAYDSIFGKVKVFAPSNAGQDGIINVCRNEPTNLLTGLTGNADLGGTWYTPGGTPTTDGADITAANTQGNYNYTYITGNGVCPNDTALVVVSVSGTCNELSVSEEMFAGVEVFPNPSAGIVFVTSDSNFSYEVTDANGRIITTAKNGVKAAQKTEINLNNVERGVYFIRLNNESAQKTYRIVIN